MALIAKNGTVLVLGSENNYKVKGAAKLLPLIGLPDGEDDALGGLVNCYKMSSRLGMFLFFGGEGPVIYQISLSELFRDKAAIKESPSGAALHN